MSESILGTKKPIESIWGCWEIDIEEGTKHKSILILKNQGFYNEILGHKGDHKIWIIVKLPKTISNEQKALFLKLKEIN